MRIKRILHSAFIISLIGTAAVSMPGCRKEANELSHSHHDHSKEDGHNHDHDEGITTKHTEDAANNEISLPKGQAAKLGIKTTEIRPGDFFETITVGGELMPSPSSVSTVTARSAGMVTLTKSSTPGSYIAKGQVIATISGKGMAGGDANESAYVTLEAAKRELDRLTPLHADGIVSTRDYNAARQAYDAAKAAASGSTSSGSTAIATTAGTLTSLLVSEGQFVDAGTPIATIASSNSLTLRANLPERNVSFLNSVSGAKFRTSYSDVIFDITDFNGHRSSDASATVASQGYIPVYFTLANNGSLSAGSYCEIYLTGRKRKNVISVPMSALSEQQGKYFIYVQLDDECYEKRPVTTGASAGDAIEILDGLHVGEKAVTEGTTFVRLAESSGIVPEGHSHSH